MKKLEKNPKINWKKPQTLKIARNWKKSCNEKPMLAARKLHPTQKPTKNFIEILLFSIKKIVKNPKKDWKKPQCELAQTPSLRNWKKPQKKKLEKTPMCKLELF